MIGTVSPPQPLVALPFNAASKVSGATKSSAPLPPSDKDLKALNDLEKRVEVWDMSSGVEQPVTGWQLLNSPDPIIKKARDNALQVDKYLREKFGRNGWDNQGSPLRVVVHAPAAPGSAVAEWDEQTNRIYLSDGDGEMFGPMGDSLDIVAHEAMHGVMRSHINVRYHGQPGGIDESWADVFGTLVDDKNWRIGEDSFTPGIPGDEIRDLKNPRFDHVDKLPNGGADVGVHDLSGIPSLAAVRVAEKIGREEMGQIWYTALTDHLTTGSGYSGAARATLNAAAQLHGADSTQVETILEAWRSVGVDPRWTTAQRIAADKLGKAARDSSGDAKSRRGA